MLSGTGYPSGENYPAGTGMELFFYPHAGTGNPTGKILRVRVRVRVSTTRRVRTRCHLELGGGLCSQGRAPRKRPRHTNSCRYSMPALWLPARPCVLHRIGSVSPLHACMWVNKRRTQHSRGNAAPFSSFKIHEKCRMQKEDFPSHQNYNTRIKVLNVDEFKN
jgi:hypothetical protein